MRYISHCVLAALLSLFATFSLAQQNLPVPETRPDIPSDKCLIELRIPTHAKVTVGNRDYGEQRSIALPLSEAGRGGFGEPCFVLDVDFPNGGRISQYVEARGGTVVRIALSAPPIETMLLEGPSAEITSLSVQPRREMDCHGNG